MTISVSELPYGNAALEPHISRRTLDFHYGKHHKSYVNKLNDAIDGTEYADMGLEDIIVASGRNSDTAVFNHAAQAFNHAFLWGCMSPDGGGTPEGDLESAIEAAFGDTDRFRSRFREVAMSQFGSGWVWLIHDAGGLRIISTSNADTPVAHGRVPLLTLDVWEHAYYLDYQNERGRYVDAFLNALINWNFAASNFEAIKRAA